MGKRIEMGTWYWMDIAPESEWEPDVRHMAELGYDYIVAGWGRRMTDLGTRVEETRRFLDTCGRHGIEVYLCLWSSLGMFPYLGDEAFCVDDKGLKRPVYNLALASSWRAGPYREYLSQVAEAYRGLPALRGYQFDDTFSLRSAEGVAHSEQGRFVSYSDEDIRAFRDWLRSKYKDVIYFLHRWHGTPEEERVSDWAAIEPPRSPESLLWSDWREARSEWFEGWARDTRAFLSDADPEAEVYLLDGSPAVLGSTDTSGVDLSRVAAHFDVVTLYGMPFGLRKEPVDMDRILASLDFLVGLARKRAPGAEIGACFHIWHHRRGDPSDELLPWPYPTLGQIRQMTFRAAQAGADKIEHYGYRIGAWDRLDRDGDGPMPEIRNMLGGREDLWEGLRELNAEVRGREWPGREVAEGSEP